MRLLLRWPWAAKAAIAVAALAVCVLVLDRVFALPPMARPNATHTASEQSTLVVLAQDGSPLRILELNRARGEGAPAGRPAAAQAGASAPVAVAAAAPASALAGKLPLLPKAVKAPEGPNPCLTDLAGIAPRRDGVPAPGSDQPVRRGAPGAPARS